MSGLEKFQDNPAWRKKLLSHLLTDRPRPTPTKSPRESMEQRHSLDIVLDFEALMKARKEELDELEKRDEARTTSALNVNSESEVMFKCGEDSQLQDADESFDAFERMCDKTASDPDNTLFQYLNSDDRDHVLALAKERSARADKSSDMEIDALRRLLDDVSCQDQLDNESPLKGVECTQLEDIEAPSRLWDNDFTINCNDSVLRTSAKTSPVKMVGLLRPSTILEANEADLTGYQSDGSSNNNSSFQTAATLKTAHSFETIASGSSCYETAANNSLASSTREAPTLNVDDLFYAAIAKAKPHGMSKGEEQELLIDLHETLIDLVANKPSESILSDGAENTIIELSSSDEEDFKVDIKLEDTSLSEAGIEIEENKENKSIHFNDTMEEMEYMMQKGLEYMAAKAALTTPNTPTKPLSDANITNPKNLSKQNTFVLTPKNIPSSPMRQGTNSGNRKLPQSSSSSRYAINMDKPMGKFFKLPSAIPMRRHLKPQKDQFAHIVSPIRTYTHKSGTAPLMSMFRQTCSQNINDAFHKLSIHELEQESRLCQLKRTHETSNVNPTKLSSDCIDSNARLLPKKAYISSELKQVVDERTPMPMPNVPKIQKYLNSAVEPTVLRHDGKMKMPDQSGRSAHSQIPRRPNQSLADLSLASGDISLYTIKDAQKF